MLTMATLGELTEHSAYYFLDLVYVQHFAS